MTAAVNFFLFNIPLVKIRGRFLITQSIAFMAVTLKLLKTHFTLLKIIDGLQGTFFLSYIATTLEIKA